MYDCWEQIEEAEAGPSFAASPAALKPRLVYTMYATMQTPTCVACFCVKEQGDAGSAVSAWVAVLRGTLILALLSELRRCYRKPS